VILTLNCRFKIVTGLPSVCCLSLCIKARRELVIVGDFDTGLSLQNEYLPTCCLLEQFYSKMVFVKAKGHGRFFIQTTDNKIHCYNVRHQRVDFQQLEKAFHLDHPDQVILRCFVECRNFVPGSFQGIVGIIKDDDSWCPFLYWNVDVFEDILYGFIQKEGSWKFRTINLKDWPVKRLAYVNCCYGDPFPYTTCRKGTVCSIDGKYQASVDGPDIFHGRQFRHLINQVEEEDRPYKLQPLEGKVDYCDSELEEKLAKDVRDSKKKKSPLKIQPLRTKGDASFEIDGVEVLTVYVGIGCYQAPDEMLYEGRNSENRFSFPDEDSGLVYYFDGNEKNFKNWYNRMKSEGIDADQLASELLSVSSSTHPLGNSVIDLEQHQIIRVKVSLNPSFYLCYCCVICLEQNVLSNI